MFSLRFVTARTPAVVITATAAAVKNGLACSPVAGRRLWLLATGVLAILPLRRSGVWLASLSAGFSGAGVTSLLFSGAFSPGLPASPCGPAGPCSPGLPASPCGPTGPGAPVSPRSPFSPFSPGAPSLPASPCAPVAPVSPFSPRSPLSPLGPAGPCSPRSPGAP
ncbi:IgA-binding beta antigen [Streptococcus pyogenes]|nr:IgA-binding beta antigen [Streptococcus pyogenes]